MAIKFQACFLNYFPHYGLLIVKELPFVECLIFQSISKFLQLNLVRTPVSIFQTHEQTFVVTS